MDHDTIFLDLGRLDERLKASPARLSWHLKMRARGIAFASTNAGIPVGVADVEQWLSGASLPPRHGEGINDNLSIATVAYFALAVIDTASDAANREAKLNMQAMFNRHAAVLDWGCEDREALDPLFEQLQAEFGTLSPARSLKSVASACQQLSSAINVHRLSAEHPGPGAEFDIPPRELPQAWLTSLFAPLLLARAGLLSSALPSLIPAIRFVDMQVEAIEAVLRQRLAEEARYGLRELDRLEQRLAGCLAEINPTRRSRARGAAEMLVSFPTLKRARLANCLAITPQGAGQLIRRIGPI